MTAPGSIRIEPFPPVLGSGVSLASPLVLDLDGDGLEVYGMRDRRIYFDVDQDGMRERTAWVKPDDGLLVLDRDGNGRIDHAGELFGYGDTIIRPDVPNRTAELVQEWESGFDRLAALDDNGDGQISAEDAAYDTLLVWRDFDGDGINQPDETGSLLDHQIVSIPTTAEPSDIEINENPVTDMATYTRVDGTRWAVGDVWFRFDQMQTDYPRPKRLSEEILALPYMEGTGNAKDLHTAMHEDPTLHRMVADLSRLEPDGLHDFVARVEAIILRWYGVGDMPATTRGRHVDAQHLAMLEVRSDTPFQQWAGPNPMPYGGASVMDSWTYRLRNATANLFSQTDLGRQMLPELTFGHRAFLFLDETAVAADVLARFEASAPEGTLERLAYWNTVVMVLDTVYLSFADVRSADDGGAGYRASVEALLQRQGLGLVYNSVLQTVIGQPGGDGLVTSSVDGRRWEGGAEVAMGGTGDDEIWLGGGEQVVYFGAGRGHDTVHVDSFTGAGFSFVPQVEFRVVGVSPDEVSIGRGTDPEASEIVITLEATGDTITVRGIPASTCPTVLSLVIDGGARRSLESLLPDWVAP